MANKRLLIVDDEPSIVKGLKYSLEQEGYEIEAAYTGDEALQKFAAAPFDMVLLDVMLPGLSGMEVCQRIRETSSVPIIMVTAKGEDMDKILGLEYGADDYLTKPFNVMELKQRIKTVFRRVASAPAESAARVVSAGELSVNLDNRTASIAGRDVSLTAKEFELLALFITNRGKLYTREQLLQLIWSGDFTGDSRTLDVHISRLRDKIEKNPKQPEYIMTKWSVGYYFADR